MVGAITNITINIPIINSSRVAVVSEETTAALEELTAVVVAADINNENNFMEDLLIEAVSLEQSRATYIKQQTRVWKVQMQYSESVDPT